MVIAKVVYFIANGKQPARIALRFLRYIFRGFAGGKHFETGAQEMIHPDRSFRAHYFITQVHATAKGPAYFKLADGAIFIFYQADSVILRIDRLYLGIGPAHYFYRPDILADKTPRNFHT